MATMPEALLDSDEIEGLVYKRLGGSYRGWREELLVEQLTNKLEAKFLLCNCCKGLMRDACLMGKEGKQELRCMGCIPEGVVWQPVEMNREAINEKLIRCPINERGCGWGDAVSRLVPHLNECGFLPVLCPLKCVESEGERSGEVVRVERRLLAEHEREYCPQRELKCEFCSRAVRACEINPHLVECDEFPVDCPNGCEVAGETDTGQMKRGAVPLHLAECPLQRVKCPYLEYGCGEEMERRQLEFHEREYIHTHFKLAIMEIKRNQLESVKKMELLDNKYDAQLLQSNNKIKSLEKLSAEKDLEIISVKTEIKELNAIFSTVVSMGRLEWKIKGVKHKIENKEQTNSEPFYVGLYKCQGTIYWDFRNLGGVGCLICIMKGKFDEKLRWPFIYRYKFVILNQARSGDDHTWSNEITLESLQRLPHCFQRPTEIRNSGYGTGSIISNTEVLTNKYCQEDSITLLISLEQLPLF